MIPIQHNEIHLWIAHDERITDTPLLESYYELLSPQELHQFERFRFPAHRHQYLITRALVRCVLSLYFENVAPYEWQFGKNPYGKPFIQHDLPIPLRFNISHTHGIVVLALACNSDIGVDVEWTQGTRDIVEIVQHCFSPIEVRQLLQLPVEQQHERFFDLWTLKEAYIKARGKGLSIALTEFSYVFSDDGSKTLTFLAAPDDTPALWRFWHIFSEAPHKIDIAHKDKSSRTRFSLSAREIVPLRDITHISVQSIGNVDTNYVRTMLRCPTRTIASKP